MFSHSTTVLTLLPHQILDGYIFTHIESWDEDAFLEHRTRLTRIINVPPSTTGTYIPQETPFSFFMTGRPFQ